MHKLHFLLSSENVLDYLRSNNLYTAPDSKSQDIELKSAKNFNLLVTLDEKQRLLVKQERPDPRGQTQQEFFKEYQVQQLINFPQLGRLHYLFPEVLHFDRENSIIIFNYLDNYRDLAEVYNKQQTYPTIIGHEIGASIAKIHRLTISNVEYRDFITSVDGEDSTSEKQIAAYISGIDRITPEVFGVYPADGLKFLTLYQRYDSLGEAIAQISASYQPCCLTHNDLKLNNLLLHNDWQQRSANSESIIRFIDWERSNWGDPAFDVGSLVASYIQIWLMSLVVSKDISLEDSLRMAVTPLELLQPSLNSLITAYLREFSEILQHQPDFLNKVVQFAGLGLIQQIQSMLQYQKVFNNTGICMLQVAKSFLCRPEASTATIFGQSATEIINAAASEPILA